MGRSAFSFPTSIEFGPGAIATLPDKVRSLGQRAFLVTDPGLRQLPIFRQATDTLDVAGIPWSDTSAISPNPLASECEIGGRLLRESGADVVIGIGGGSALDGAKGVALMATHEGPITRYDDAMGGWEHIREDVLPVIAIPTTAGTGSEVGRSTVVVDDESHRKIVIFSPHLMPRFAVVDSRLMVDMPAWLTAATGFDALTHNLEALTARGYHPLADALALEGLALVHTHLPIAYREPSNLTARDGMAMAAMMGATAFQKGLGAAHSLAHPLSSLAGLHHGLSNAVVLPYVVAFNQTVSSEAYELVAHRLRLKGSLLTWLLELRSTLGIPHTLADAGVSAGLVADLAAQAFQDACHQSNPRTCSPEDLRTLYDHAFAGVLPTQG